MSMAALSASPALSFSLLGASSCLSRQPKRPTSLVARKPRCQAATEEERHVAARAQPRRRDAMLALTAVSAAPLLLPGLAPPSALAANIVERAQRAEFQVLLRNALAGAVEANQDLIPSLLRLAINDAATYDKASKTGGANGSIHFAEELGRPENKGLSKAVEFLEGVKKGVDEGAPGGPLSYADLIQFGAAAACKRVFLNACISKAGGDTQKGIDLYRAIGSAGQWGSFEKKFGRADAAGADPAGRVPVWDTLSPQELKATFEPLAVKPREIVVLAIFLTDDLPAFEAKLAQDAEFAPYVSKYQKSRQTTSQTSYEVDLIAAFTKFSTLGAPINTEAYTYPYKPPSIRF